MVNKTGTKCTLWNSDGSKVAIKHTSDILTNIKVTEINRHTSKGKRVRICGPRAEKHFGTLK
jgi:hypothetical protein